MKGKKGKRREGMGREGKGETEENMRKVKGYRKTLRKGRGLGKENH